MSNALREHLRLSVIEVKRIVWRKRFLIVVLIALATSCNDLFNFRPSGTPPGLYGLGVTTTFGNELNALLAGFSSADALAIDTEVGFTGLLVARHIRRRDYILQKAIAILAVAALAIFLRYAFLMLMGAVVLRWDVALLGECQLSLPDATGRHYCAVLPLPNTLKEAMGPFPALFLTHPVLNDLIYVGLVALGTGVMSLLGLLVAACGGNAYLAIATPIVLTFGIPNAVSDFSRWLNPTSLIYAKWGYFRMFPGLEYRLGIWFLWWLAWVVVLVGASMIIAEKRELGPKVHRL